MQGSAPLFFFLFVVVLAATYIALRRRLASPAVVSGAGVVAAIVASLLMSLSQGNGPLHALVVGIVMGVFFTGIILAIAGYFQSVESRSIPQAADE